MNIYRCETCKFYFRNFSDSTKGVWNRCNIGSCEIDINRHILIERVGCASHSNFQIVDVMKDITAPAFVQIQIKKDSKVVWINTENGCQFRARQIKFLEVNDHRINKSECEQDDCRV